jgi:endonuclease YncB( thermonuclease family)
LIAYQEAYDQNFPEKKNHSINHHTHPIYFQCESFICRSIQGHSCHRWGYHPGHFPWEKITVRLIGIDAPDVSHSKNTPGQPFSEAATKYLAGIVQNKTVEIISYGPDRYGRILAEVIVDGRNVNIEMLKAGYAEVYRGDSLVEILDTKAYWQAEEEARAAQRGIWSQGNYMSPMKWRKTHQN